MKRRILVALLVAFAAPALADCLPEGQLPKTLTSDSGATIELKAREGDAISYRQTIAESGKQIDMVVHAGIFTLEAKRGEEGAVFDWTTDLPSVADLTPGASFHEEAILTTPGILPPRPFTTDVTVVGREEITIAGCKYEALKVVVKNNEAGRDLGENTKWIHLPSLTTLRSELREGEAVHKQEMIAVE